MRRPAGSEAKALAGAARTALAGEIDARATKLSQAPDARVRAGVRRHGALDRRAGRQADRRRRRAAAARCASSPTSSSPAPRARRCRRGSISGSRPTSSGCSAPLFALAAAEDITGIARGVAFQLIEALGVLERQKVAEDVKGLDQPSRATLAQIRRALRRLSPLSAGAAQARAAQPRGAALGAQARQPGRQGPRRVAAARVERPHLDPGRQGHAEAALPHRRLSGLRRARGARRYSGAARRSDPSGAGLARRLVRHEAGRRVRRLRLHRHRRDDVAHRRVGRGLRLDPALARLSHGEAAQTAGAGTPPQPASRDAAGGSRSRGRRRPQRCRAGDAADDAGAETSRTDAAEHAPTLAPDAEPAAEAVAAPKRPPLPKLRPRAEAAGRRRRRPRRRRRRSQRRRPNAAAAAKPRCRIRRARDDRGVAARAVRRASAVPATASGAAAAVTNGRAPSPKASPPAKRPRSRPPTGSRRRRRHAAGRRRAQASVTAVRVTAAAIVASARTASGKPPKASGRSEGRRRAADERQRAARSARTGRGRPSAATVPSARKARRPSAAAGPRPRSRSRTRQRADADLGDRAKSRAATRSPIRIRRSPSCGAEGAARGQQGTLERSASHDLDRQRIDKWLWHARVVRTRSAAAALVDAGHVRVNGARIDASSRPVRPGDVVTVALDRNVRILKVTGFAERRGSAEIARVAVRGSDAAARAAARSRRPAARDAGAGRPTKRERREIDRLQGRDEFD